MNAQTATLPAHLQAILAGAVRVANTFAVAAGAPLAAPAANPAPMPDAQQTAPAHVNAKPIDYRSRVQRAIDDSEPLDDDDYPSILDAGFGLGVDPEC